MRYYVNQALGEYGRIFVKFYLRVYGSRRSRGLYINTPKRTLYPTILTKEA